MTKSVALNLFTEWIEDSVTDAPAWVLADLDQELPRLRQLLHAAGIDTRSPGAVFGLLASTAVLMPFILNHAGATIKDDAEHEAFALYVTAAFRQVGVLVRELARQEGVWPA